MEKDLEGRITKVEKDDDINNGHSVCNACGKDMPVCWDMVCYKCDKTFCYKCAVSWNGRWYCSDCQEV